MPLRKVAACLPVTALAAVDTDHVKSIIAASGPLLKVWDLKTNCCIIQQTPTHSPIHGIVFQKEEDESEHFQSFSVLSWGGRSFSISKLIISCSSTTNVQSRLIRGSETQIEDWILDARIWPTDDDAYGSHLTRAGLVTLHNTLYGAQKMSVPPSGDDALNVVKLGSGLQSILYSANIKVSSSTTLLIASGTVFGEVIVWSYSSTNSCSSLQSSRATCQTHYVLHGHQGSIFGVSISDKISIQASSTPIHLLASCSDDRTIRVWNIGSCLHNSRAAQLASSVPSLDQVSSPSTGFSYPQLSPDHLGPSCIVSDNAHHSRIWGAFFFTGFTGLQGDEIELVSIGEDANMHRWMITIREARPSGFLQGEIRHIIGDFFHSGKNIWSYACLEAPNGPLATISGGADGAVALRYNEGSPSTGVTDTATYKTADGKAFRSLNSSHGPPKSPILKNYTWLSDSCFLATGDRGEIWKAQLADVDRVKGETNHERCGENDSIFWQPISAVGHLTSSSVSASSKRQGIALISDESRRLWLATIEVESLHFLVHVERKIANIYIMDVNADLLPSVGAANQLSLCLLTYLGADSVDLICVYRSSGSNKFEYREIAVLQLPATFKVTSCLFQPLSSTLILGSRAGALAVYRLALEAREVGLQPLFCKRHVHGEDAVTCLLLWPNLSSSETYFLSCGRDGHYALHVLSYKDDRPTLDTLHRSALPFGPYIEGAFFPHSSHELLLYGFRGKEFVVWNESAQAQVLSLECGGAHRSWAYRNYHNQGGCFVWTQASCFNLFSQSQPGHLYLQKGGHGREIKAVAVSASHTKPPLILTGAEDTSIRFFTLVHDDSTRSELRCVRTFKKHTAGIQHLQWSPCGRLLLSSSGYEELFVWRVSSIPGFGPGAVCEAVLPKETPISDLRITSFDIYALDTEATGDLHYLVAAAYSNSVIKVFRYNTSDAMFEPEAGGQYKTNCLTQVAFLPRYGDPSQYHLLSASTDGRLAIWRSVPPEEYGNSADIAKLRCEGSHPVHQSSVKALQLTKLSANLVLIVTGGDDNALGLTVMGLARSSKDKFSAQSGLQICSLIIPKAHAATTTAVSIVPDYPANPGFFIIYSAANDQRVKFWKVAVDIPFLETLDCKRWTEAIEVIKVASHHTNVADVGAMCALKNFGDGAHGSDITRLAIAGVGIEMCEIDT